MPQCKNLFLEFLGHVVVFFNLLCGIIPIHELILKHVRSIESPQILIV